VVFGKKALTEGKFGVSLVTLIDQNYDEKKIIQLVASLKNNPEHPIKSAPLCFIPWKNLEKEGYGQYKKLFEQ